MPPPPEPPPAALPPAGEAAPDHAGWIAVGQVLGAFGPSGELRVQPFSRSPERFCHLRRVYVGEERVPARITHRRLHPPGIILRLNTVTSREQARALFGTYLYVPESEAVPLPEGEYFVHQIIGLNVITTDGQPLGTVKEVLHTGSNDVYVVRGERGEILLPAIKEVIKQVDLDAGTLLVELTPGLID
ncbi:MAG: 16S rRNA processing protein RimM [Chloroflexi bacterium]|nr:16S rRNA processing protein RimM [Chloroflexota bacterium]